MMNEFLDVNVIAGPVPLAVYSVAGALAATLLVRRYRPRMAKIFAVAAGLGAGLGLLITWLVSDVWDVFGVSFSPVTRGWVVAFGAGLGTVVVALAHAPRWRRACAVIAIPAFLVAAATGINADFGQYATVRSLFGVPYYGALDVLANPVSPSSAPMPVAGRVGYETIPATVSGFAARQALVYLPPAALLADPPTLPVIEVLSGQPGSPQDVFQAGNLAPILDAYANAHEGLAPIVVVPDQLGAPEKNPMCVDSALGKSATYLTVDVPRWIRSTFAVPSSPGGWAIAGFSQGGTCSIQLGAAHPEIYDTVFDISGELVPQLGSDAETISKGFGGSAAAYAAAAPTAILAAHAPYADFEVITAVGENDGRYRPFAQQISEAAGKAGAVTHSIMSPGTAHDWHTVQYAWNEALPLLAARAGLGAS